MSTNIPSSKFPSQGTAKSVALPKTETQDVVDKPKPITDKPQQQAVANTPQQQAADTAKALAVLANLNQNFQIALAALNNAKDANEIKSLLKNLFLSQGLPATMKVIETTLATNLSNGTILFNGLLTLLQENPAFLTQAAQVAANLINNKDENEEVTNDKSNTPTNSDPKSEQKPLVEISQKPAPKADLLIVFFKKVGESFDKAKKLTLELFEASKNGAQDANLTAAEKAVVRATANASGAALLQAAGIVTSSAMILLAENIIRKSTFNDTAVPITALKVIAFLKEQAGEVKQV